jgi:hypothetical protein
MFGEVGVGERGVYKGGREEMHPKGVRVEGEREDEN